MRNQYPQEPVTYQCSEPRDYLITFEGIRQISAEKLEVIKANFRKEKKDAEEAQSAILNKDEGSGLSSFIYVQDFTASDNE